MNPLKLIRDLAAEAIWAIGTARTVARAIHEMTFEDWEDYEGDSLIVLGNDTIICSVCYEPEFPFELDPGLVPYGTIEDGQCAVCGYTVPSGITR